jgi:hypothetical protein
MGRRLEGGKSGVAGEDTPRCSASVRRPPSLPQTTCLGVVPAIFDPLYTSRYAGVA